LVKKYLITAQLKKMKEIKYPYTVDNGYGEQITFTRLVKDPEGDWLECESLTPPNSGVPMHVHHLQDEGLTVLEGTIGIEILGQPIQYHGVGATLLFKAGEPHRFWNTGTTPLRCAAYVKPAHSFEYFMGSIFESTASNAKPAPKTFDAAWLSAHFRTEVDMLAVPTFVKKIIFPIVLFIGKLQGKDKKFKDAPKAFTTR
jgi:mannose-6-phosphate isomerase-like protein (cupin superfamily)